MTDEEYTRFKRIHPIVLNKAVVMLISGSSFDKDLTSIKSFLNWNSIECNDIKMYDYPCFGEQCDLFIFHMGEVDNTLFGTEVLDGLAGMFVKTAKTMPSTKFVVATPLLDYAILDAMKEQDIEVLSNVYFSFNDLRIALDLERGNLLPQ